MINWVILFLMFAVSMPASACGRDCVRSETRYYDTSRHSHGVEPSTAFSMAVATGITMACIIQRMNGTPCYDFGKPSPVVDDEPLQLTPRGLPGVKAYQ